MSRYVPSDIAFVILGKLRIVEKYKGLFISRELRQIYLKNKKAAKFLFTYLWKKNKVDYDFRSNIHNEDLEYLVSYGKLTNLNINHYSSKQAGQIIRLARYKDAGSLEVFEDHSTILYLVVFEIDDCELFRILLSTKAYYNKVYSYPMTYEMTKIFVDRLEKDPLICLWITRKPLHFLRYPDLLERYGAIFDKGYKRHDEWYAEVVYRWLNYIPYKFLIENGCYNPSDDEDKSGDTRIMISRILKEYRYYAPKFMDILQHHVGCINVNEILESWFGAETCETNEEDNDSESENDDPDDVDDLNDNIDDPDDDSEYERFEKKERKADQFMRILIGICDLYKCYEYDASIILCKHLMKFNPKIKEKFISKLLEFNIFRCEIECEKRISDHPDLCCAEHYQIREFDPDL